MDFRYPVMVRECMNNANHTNESLAREVERSPSLIAKVACGKMPMQPDLASSIADALQAPQLEYNYLASTEIGRKYLKPVDSQDLRVNGFQLHTEWSDFERICPDLYDAIKDGHIDPEEEPIVLQAAKELREASNAGLGMCVVLEAELKKKKRPERR
jgi:hypothetical protein